MTTLVQTSTGWWSEMVDGARKAFGLAGIRRAPKPPKQKKQKKVKRTASTRSKLDHHARASLTRRLADEGFDRAQISRRTGLSQDTVGLLLKMTPERPEETAGNGNFFRMLQSRLHGSEE